jgi:hypothetical protein
MKPVSTIRLWAARTSKRGFVASAGTQAGLFVARLVFRT